MQRGCTKVSGHDYLFGKIDTSSLTKICTSVSVTAIRGYNEWQWEISQEISWVLLKEIITSDWVSQYIGPNLTFKPSSDANKDGIDAPILQLHGSTIGLQ